MTRTATPAAPPRARARTARRMPLKVRKGVLAVHVTVAVGWVGIETAQLLLGLVGLFTGSAEMLRATRLVMELLGIELIAVVAWSTLITGLVLSLATPWGLLKHYWIATKLAINVALMLAGHFFFQHWLRRQAEVGGAPESVSVQLMAGMGTAFVLLLTAVAVSVYKPWGKTRRGRKAR